MKLRDHASGEGNARADRAPILTRRSLLRSGLAGLLAAPWANWFHAASDRVEREAFPDGDRVGEAALPEDEIVLGMSAAFSGPSRGWAASYTAEPGLVDNFVGVGRKRIAVFYQADAYGRSGWAGVRAALKAHGERIAGEATYRRGQRFTGSMRRQVEILQAASPEAVICIGSYAACAGFARDAVDLGLRVPIANLSFVGSENLLQLLSEGRDNPEDYTRFLINSQVVPSYEDTSIPAVREYRELMARHDPKVPGELVREPYSPFPQSFVSLEGFLDAKLMTEILRRLGERPDRAGLEGAVFSVQGFDLGIGEQVSFGPARRQGLQTVYYTVVQDGRFVTLEDWQTWLG